MFNRKKEKIIIGAVHFLPLLGVETFSSLETVYQTARKDVFALVGGGVGGVIFENNYDLPHKINVGSETVASMTYLVGRLKADIPKGVLFGISVLWNDYRAALSIAKVTGADFVRVPVFVDDVRTKYGDVFCDPVKVTSYRKSIDAEEIKLFTDIHVKHAKLLSKLTIEQSAIKAVFYGSDGLIVTGDWTAEAPSLNDLVRVRKAIGFFPLIVGSGADEKNIKKLLAIADGVIVSTSLKYGTSKIGHVNIKSEDQRISEKKVARLIAALKT